MNTDTKENGIVVRYNQYNVALVTLEDYKKLKARLSEAERLLEIADELWKESHKAQEPMRYSRLEGLLKEYRKIRMSMEDKSK